METGLDLETKGLIEKQIEYIYETDIMFSGKLEWIIESDKDLTSYEDFVLGYYLGSLFSTVRSQANQIKQSKDNQRRFEEYKKELETNPKNARLEYVYVELTDEEMDEIRDTIKRWSLLFRKKLNGEIQLRDLNNTKKKSKS